MENAITKEARSKMGKSLEAFQVELGHIRTGRASTGLLDNIEVDAYGAKMKLNQVATITVPEPRMLMVQPWDKTQLQAIEKALQTSPLDITPSNDGNVIRLPLPELNEDRRKELGKVIAKLAEEARISVRNVRRHEVETVKQQQKDGDVPEDDAHKLMTEIQKITDEFVGKIDEVLKAKDAEIMEV